MIWREGAQFDFLLERIALLLPPRMERDENGRAVDAETVKKAVAELDT